MNRLCLLRGTAVDQPFLTPRFAINGRNAPGRRKVGGNCAQLAGSLGAMSRGLRQCWACGGGKSKTYLFDRYGGRKTPVWRPISYLQDGLTQHRDHAHYGKIDSPPWFTTLLLPRWCQPDSFTLGRTRWRVRMPSISVVIGRRG